MSSPMAGTRGTAWDTWRRTAIRPSISSATKPCQAGMTTRSSQTPGQWATQWRRRRTRAGSARSSSADRPAPHGRVAPCGRAPPAHPAVLATIPAGQGNRPPFSGPEKRLVKNGSQDCLQQRVTSPPTPTLPDTCSHSAPGGFVFKLPHHSRTVQRE